MAQALAGKGDPCRQTNVYDARALIAAGQNQAAGAVIGNVATATMATAGIIAGADVLKTAVNNAGAKTTTNITGDHNSATHTSYDTRAHTDNNVSTGDNSPVSVRNPLFYFGCISMKTFVGILDILIHFIYLILLYV